jgi:hypothetical protein
VEDEMAGRKNNESVNQATVDADQLRAGIDGLLQKDQLDNDKAMAGDKPRRTAEPAADPDKAAKLNEFHQG